MNDPNLEYVLHVVGYLVASHTMLRASRSRTGKNEVTLTADLADIFQRYQVYSDFMSYCRSRGGANSALDLQVRDLHSGQEGRTGADLLFVARGRDVAADGAETWFRKLALVQAKRIHNTNSSRYADSTNHVDHAKKMAKKVGIDGSYFVYYHSSAALAHLPTPPRPPIWPGVTPHPELLAPPIYRYSTPMMGDHYFFPSITQDRIPSFIEASDYRKKALMEAPPDWFLPNGYEWGAVLHCADFFISKTSKGHWRQRRNRGDLPSVSYVLQHGWPLQSFLVRLCQCNEGVRYADDRSLLQAVHDVCEDADLRPMAVVMIQFDSRSPQQPDVAGVNFVQLANLLPLEPEDHSGE